ncbi:MAG: FMN-binding protein [Sedimentibacter sp.]
MKKAVSLILVLLMVTSLFGCASQTTTEPKAEAVTLTGTGEGFGGDVTVTVTKEGDKITKVEAVGDKETAGIGDKAIKELPAKIVEANSTEVDVIGGATFSSKGIIYAVNNALDPAKYPWPVAAEEPKAEEPKAEVPVGEAGSIAKVGIGQNISIAKSKDATAEATATAQADVTIAAVGFDADGKVASVTIDVAQTKVAFDKDMKVTSDRAAEVKSKKDLGPEYGMVKASTIGKEWFEQIEAFENWMIGKTVDEITGLKVKARDEAHPAVPDVPELTSSVTISVDAYQEAVEEAWNNAEDVAGAESVGLGVVTHIGSSKDKAADVKPVAQMDTYMTATALDKDGKVAKAIVDVAQVKVNYDENGVVTSDKTVAPQTKKEIKEGYGMIKASSIGKEWFEQMEAFEEWMVGKTVDEINGLKVKVRDEKHTSVPDVPELTSSVTITVEGYQEIVSEAIANAR